MSDPQPHPVAPATPLVMDSLVIGGGPAGLTAAVYLARFRRSVLLVDAGHSRAAGIPLSHNHPGAADGVSGAALVGALRAQAERYPVRFVHGRVEHLASTDGGFDAICTDGTHVRAATVLLATGASDVEPPLPHAAKAVREGLLRYCPVCDGYEVIDQAVGVLARDAHGAHEALYLRRYTDRLCLFTDGHGERLDAALRQRLQQAGIVCIDEPTHGITLQGQQVAVHHGDTTTHCDSLYAALGLRVHAELAIGLGAAANDDGYLQVDAHHRTTVRGLYAAGDVARGLNQISVAYGGAAIAASAMHLEMNAREAASGTPVAIESGPAT
jgi:thioredoxin reductase (NADPH)